ncbi:MAG TPA: AAA family ATPase [Tepidisphaeraceae bacterium]|nr:AAA family ATPase [Tepidisphaeraceae bacterium]
MFVPFTAVVVDVDPVSRQEIFRALGASGVAVASQLDTLDPLPAMLGRNPAPPQLVIVNLDSNAREVLRRVSSLVRKFPAMHLIALSRAATAELLMDAMDAGVKGFVPLPLDRARLMAAIERLREGESGDRRARIIQFVPTIGGCGATTLACGVAAALAKLGKTIIIDLDLVRGAVANGFDVRPRQSIADVAGTAVLDKTRLDAALAVQRETGLAVLARPDAPEDAQGVTPEGLTNVLELVGSAFDFVVIDSTMSLDPLHTAAARAADVNVLVMQLSVPSAKNTERYLHALRRMGIDTDATSQIVVNRFTPERADIQPGEIERALGLKVAWTLPNDFATAMGSINFGEPVTQRSPRTELSRSIVGLAQLLAGRAEAAAQAVPQVPHQVRSPT